MRETAQPLVLIADDNATMRELLAAVVSERCDVAVIEAEDGSHAVQLGLQERPDLALLDLHMPRLDGIRAARTLQGLVPTMPLALHSSDPAMLRQLSRDLELPVFDKLDLEKLTAWVASQARSRRRPDVKLDLVCASCGYGIFAAAPPARCPLCQADDSWVAAPRRSAAGSGFGR